MAAARSCSGCRRPSCTDEREYRIPSKGLPSSYIYDGSDPSPPGCRVEEQGWDYSASLIIYYSHWNFENLTPDSDSSTSKVPKTCFKSLFFFLDYSYLVVGGAYPQFNLVRYESGVQKIVKNGCNLRDANSLDAGKQAGRRGHKICSRTEPTKEEEEKNERSLTFA